MKDPIKTAFLIGIAVVAGSGLLSRAIRNNKTKIKASFRAAKEAWERTEEIEEAPVVSTSPIA